MLNFSTFAPESTTSSESTSSSYEPPPVNMTVNQGDGVCLMLRLTGDKISDLDVYAPKSMANVNLPPQYHGQIVNSTYDHYASAVVYNDPAQFDFTFGATAAGAYVIGVAEQGVTVAILDVTVLFAMEFAP